MTPEQRKEVADRSWGQDPPKRPDPVWPSEELERQMLADTGEMVAGSIAWHKAPDLACHVRALLVRVRDLEAEMARLRRYEQAMQSMAEQFISPKTTAEEMVADILKEPRGAKRACR